VRIVGGTGDKGADVLGVSRGQLWVFQCKHTTSSFPPKAAIEEVVEAARFYDAERLVVVTSRPTGIGFTEEKARFERQGLKIEVFGPATLLGLMSRTPEYSRHRRHLRPYQQDAVLRFREGLTDTGRGQVVLATGLGKTIVMAELVADLYREQRIQRNRVLVLAHTRPLVDQLHKAFWFQLPSWIPTHQLADGEMPSFWEGITFATIQSVLGRLDSLPPFGLVLIDEAHHVGADMFQNAIEKLNPPMIGGVTATPWRGDGFDIDTILGTPLVRLGIEEGLRRGFLAEVDYRLLADNLDWEFVQQASEFRYSLSQLNRKLIIPTRDEQAARIIREAFDKEGRHSCVVFCPTILHAQSMAAMLRTYGVRTEAISSENPGRERDALLARFRRGDLDALTSVDLFNEGVDVPDVDLICFMRATHSRRIFVQQLGRGLRMSPGKEKVIVLDFVTDLRRIAEVLVLDKALRASPVERLGLGERVVRFNDASAGDLLKEWILDQASLLQREGDPALELPQFEFPDPPAPGGVQ
jgi:superfamily II DNA or RNA helicase